jgi:hypothetical protein
VSTTRKKGEILYRVSLSGRGLDGTEEVGYVVRAGGG